MIKRTLIAALAMLPAAAWAQSPPGPYISLQTGVNFAGNPQSAGDFTRISTNAGPLGSVAIGWHFGNGFSADLEGSYRANDISGIATLRSNGAQEPLSNVTGTMATKAVMANLEYDIPYRPFGMAIQPFIGGGIGYGWLDLNGAQGNGRLGVTGPFGTRAIPDDVSFGSAGAFAYQAMIGLAVPTGTQGLALTVEYRYFGTAQADIPVTRVSLPGALPRGIQVSERTSDAFAASDNSIMIGLRYDFGN